MIVSKNLFENFSVIYEDIKDMYIYDDDDLHVSVNCSTEVLKDNVIIQQKKKNNEKENCLHGHPLLLNWCNVCCKDTCRSK
jgi:hypothetical protein